MYPDGIRFLANLLMKPNCDRNFPSRESDTDYTTLFDTRQTKLVKSIILVVLKNISFSVIDAVYYP